MEIIVFVGIGFVLVIILWGLIFALLSSKKKRIQMHQEAMRADTQVMSLETLSHIIEDKNTTTKELKEALDLVLHHYGVIDNHFDIYMEMMFSVCLHPNTNKNIVINFEKELRRLNPNYKSEINEALTKGLNSRGA